LIGADAKELHQEFRRVLAAVAPQPLRGSEAMGFRELLYFRVVGCLVDQGVRLTPEQKREIFAVFGRQSLPIQGSWLRREGQLMMRGAVPLSMDLSTVSQELRYRYRLLQRPKGVVERNPAICSGQPVFSGTRIPVAVVVEQLRAGVSPTELQEDFPQLSRTALDYAEIQARIPKPPGRPRKALRPQRG
jgi:uncharacterized protein (DUF433 family)